MNSNRAAVSATLSTPRELQSITHNTFCYNQHNVSKPLGNCYRDRFYQALFFLKIWKHCFSFKNLHFLGPLNFTLFLDLGILKATRGSQRSESHIIHSITIFKTYGVIIYSKLYKFYWSGHFHTFTS